MTYDGDRSMDLSKYQYVVGYGIGQYYDYVKTQIPDDIHLDYLCDARWEQIGEKYDGIEVISPDTLSNFRNTFVVVFSGNQRNFQSISSMLENMGFPYMHADKVIDAMYSITGKQLKESGSTVHSDSRGNRIIFSSDIEDTVTISFQGNNNLIKIEQGVSIGKLNICCGREATCVVGKGTEIEDAQIFITDGSVVIGEDCLFSHQITLRNHDTHHIFDKNTGKRINYAGNMKIGNHVWLGHGVTLLGSAEIGDNSIVGTMAVTSGTFPKEVIVAGNPARIVREHVCWSKDNTNFYNRNSLDECMAKEAEKYF